jgi:hypothetical protein
MYEGLKALKENWERGKEFCEYMVRSLTSCLSEDQNSFLAEQLDRYTQQKQYFESGLQLMRADGSVAVVPESRLRK